MTPIDASLTLIDVLFSLFSLLIILRSFLSFIRPDPYHPAIQFIIQMTDPILEPLRRVIPPIGMLDITPVVALILLQVIQQALVTMLISLGG